LTTGGEDGGLQNRPVASAFELLSFVYACKTLAVVQAAKLQTGAGDQ
jgi:hypothetical protein